MKPTLNQSRVKLTIPNRGSIEIVGDADMVTRFFGDIKYRFTDMLITQLEKFEGTLIMTEAGGRTKGKVVVSPKGSVSSEPK